MSLTLRASCRRDTGTSWTDFDGCLYLPCAAELAIDIGLCQYRRMSKSLVMLSPHDTAACCAPLSREPLSRAQAERVAPQLKALADSVRLRLMSLVASHPG